MKNAILVMVHLLTRLAVLLGTGGTRAVLAENILLKQQLLVLQRPRRRAPNLRTADRWLFGFCALYMANCHLSSDWQFKQSVAEALAAVILKTGGLRGWAARFLPGRVAG